MNCLFRNRRNNLRVIIDIHMDGNRERCKHFNQGSFLVKKGNLKRQACAPQHLRGGFVRIPYSSGFWASRGVLSLTYNTLQIILSHFALAQVFGRFQCIISENDQNRNCNKCKQHEPSNIHKKTILVSCHNCMIWSNNFLACVEPGVIAIMPKRSNTVAPPGLNSALHTPG